MPDVERVLVPGLFAKAPSENAPEWIKCNLSLRPSEMIRWLQTFPTDDWVNINVKQSKAGGWYTEYDDWKPMTKPPGF